MQESFAPTAIGTQADAKAGVDISKVYGGYFSSPENAQAFFDLGVKVVEAQLPKELAYIDYGGGQGFLAKVVKEQLESHGHKVDASVTDSNSEFLQKAKAIGLKTHLCNLEECEVKDADLITMRAVLHYNPSDKQREILKNAIRSLKLKGFFVHQASSGTEANSRLRSEIVNLESLGRAGNGQYHWTSIDETLQLHERAGFSETTLVGFAPNAAWGPDEQWDRFNGKTLVEAKRLGDLSAIMKIESRRDEFLSESNSLIEKFLTRYGVKETGVEKMDNGKCIIHYQYPVIVSQK